MALIGDVQRKQPKHSNSGARIVQQLMLVPEAVILVGLLAIAWLLDFPVIIGMLAILTMAVFGLRLLLLALTERQLAHGAYERADQFARAALRINPWSSDGLMLRAQGLSHQGDDEAAEALLRSAVTLYPDDQSLRSALAAALFAQGRIKEGWQIAGVVQTSHVNSPQFVQQRAWMALHVEEDAAKARSLIEAINPGQLPPRVALPLLATLCEAQIVLNAPDEAQRLIKQIEERLTACPLPQQAELLYHLGRFKTALGEDGTSDFRRSVELDPDGRYAQLAWRSAVSSAA